MGEKWSAALRAIVGVGVGAAIAIVPTIRGEDIGPIQASVAVALFTGSAGAFVDRVRKRGD